MDSKGTMLQPSEFKSLLEANRTGGNLSLSENIAPMMGFVAAQDDPKIIWECLSQASAVQEYLARHHLPVSEHNAGLKLKMFTEHRLGGWLSKNVRRGRPEKKGHNGHFIPECLGEENERKHISKRAQKLASLDWETIEELIDERTAKEKKANQAGILRKLLDEEDNVFDLLDELEDLYRWAIKRRLSWPEVFRSMFKDRMHSVIDRLTDSESEGSNGVDTGGAGESAA